MAKDTNKKRAEQLRMAIGTAQNRLKKMILFKLVRECGYDNCYRCGEKIKNIDDLSIEHKQPWYQRDTDLFWDLDNIAFSHMKCNRPHKSPGSISLRKIGLDGTEWCGTCQDFLPKKEFYPDPKRWNGVRSTCIKCNHKEHRVYYQKTMVALG